MQPRHSAQAWSWLWNILEQMQRQGLASCPRGFSELVCSHLAKRVGREFVPQGGEIFHVIQGESFTVM